MTYEPLGPWMLPADLEELHDVVIDFAVAVNGRADAQYEKNISKGPLSFKALQRLHRTGIVTHRSVKSLCVAGWTPTTPSVMRTLVDVLVSIIQIAQTAKDAEFMGFRYMAHGFIEGMYDQDAEPALQELDALQVQLLKSNLPDADMARADQLIVDYKTRRRPYWYWPQVSNPGNFIKDNMPQLWVLWHSFCGATHGADIGSVLFHDDPNGAGINPEENPRRTRMATVISSRFLLDNSHARAEFEGVADDEDYRRVVRDFIRPQQGR
jgi:hypothetical protein